MNETNAGFTTEQSKWACELLTQYTTCWYCVVVDQRPLCMRGIHRNYGWTLMLQMTLN